MHRGKVSAVLAACAVAATVGIAAPASASPAAPAKSAMAFVVPSNCFTNPTYYLKEVDRYGNLVRNSAVAAQASWGYSTSGASVYLRSVGIWSNDGRPFLANANWTWGSASGVGVSLPWDGEVETWFPPVVWQTVASHPAFHAHWYDGDNNSWGVTATLYPCNF